MSCPIPCHSIYAIVDIESDEKNDSTNRKTELKISNKQQLKVPNKDSSKQEQQTYCIPTDTNSKRIMLAYRK